MPKVAAVRDRVRERELLYRFIVRCARPGMPACSSCEKAGATCFIAPKVNRACALCVRQGAGHKCDAFMNERECKSLFDPFVRGLLLTMSGNRVSIALERIREERRVLKRRLRQLSEESDKLHKKRQGMFAKGLENLDRWDALEDSSEACPVLVPGDGVVYDFSDNPIVLTESGFEWLDVPAEFVTDGDNGGSGAVL